MGLRYIVNGAGAVMPMCGSRFWYLRHHPSQVIREQTAPVSTDFENTG
jgi:hypothetical protein